MVEQSQYATTTKYIVKAHFDVQGVVEKPDVVGAVFGQTEGLFGPDLDLRELQKSGRIGRIEINLDSKRDKTTGSIVIFFFQAEDGIRDGRVTGVQTCALPISARRW